DVPAPERLHGPRINWPTLSADGRYLALVVTDWDHVPIIDSELRIIDVATRSKVDLGRCPTHADGGVAWSPRSNVFVGTLGHSGKHQMRDWVWDVAKKEGFVLAHDLTRCAEWKCSPGGSELMTTMATRLYGEDANVFVLPAHPGAEAKACTHYRCVHW